VPTSEDEMAKQKLIDLFEDEPRKPHRIARIEAAAAGFLRTIEENDLSAGDLDDVGRAVAKRSASSAKDSGDTDVDEDDDQPTCNSCGAPVDADGDFQPNDSSGGDDTDPNSDNDDDDLNLEDLDGALEGSRQRESTRRLIEL
jgi:hypothetical protein